MHIPDSHADILRKKAFAQVATIMPDGTPQLTPVWVDYDGEHVLFNTARGRRKDKNLRRDPHVAITVTDPDNPYRYVQVRGEVAEDTTDGADAHIDRLAKKYMGVDEYPNRRPGEKRVIYKIKPEKVQVMG